MLLFGVGRLQLGVNDLRPGIGGNIGYLSRCWWCSISCCRRSVRSAACRSGSHDWQVRQSMQRAPS
jgi:hypothetical protein